MLRPSWHLSSSWELEICNDFWEFDTWIRQAFLQISNYWELEQSQRFREVEQVYSGHAQSGTSRGNDPTRSSISWKPKDCLETHWLGTHKMRARTLDVPKWPPWGSLEIGASASQNCLKSLSSLFHMVSIKVYAIKRCEPHKNFNFSQVESSSVTWTWVNKHA